MSKLKQEVKLSSENQQVGVAKLSPASFFPFTRIALAVWAVMAIYMGFFEL